MHYTVTHWLCLSLPEVSSESIFFGYNFAWSFRNTFGSTLLFFLLSLLEKHAVCLALD
uniref:Uncharacterized protein n=1 Tax=Anguilla anguilla TaxID=7936 RepID=A0A0E9Q6B2_ANGAN